MTDQQPRNTQAGNPQSASPVYSAEQARGGRIVLNTPARRWIFIGGLVGIVLLPFILLAFAG